MKFEFYVNFEKFHIFAI